MSYKADRRGLCLRGWNGAILDRDSTKNKKMRSLRTEYSAISTVAFSSDSGGIDGRPTAEYIFSKTGDSSRSTPSTTFFTCRSGCRSGTFDSGEMRQNMLDWGVLVPRMPPLYKIARRSRSPKFGPPGVWLRRVFQQPASSARRARSV